MCWASLSVPITLIYSFITFVNSNKFFHISNDRIYLSLCSFSSSNEHNNTWTMSLFSIDATEQFHFRNNFSYTPQLYLNQISLSSFSVLVYFCFGHKKDILKDPEVGCNGLLFCSGCIPVSYSVFLGIDFGFTMTLTRIQRFLKMNAWMNNCSRDTKCFWSCAKCQANVCTSDHL